MLSAHHYQPTDAYATDTASGKQGTYHDGGSGEDAAKNAAAGAMVDLFNNKLSATYLDGDCSCMHHFVDRSDEVPGCSFVFATCVTFDSISALKAGTSSRKGWAWKRMCADGIIGRGFTGSQAGWTKHDSCCAEECGSCDQSTCLTRMPGGVPSQVAWEAKCCPDVIARTADDCESAADTSCKLPEDYAISGFASGAVDANAAQIAAFENLLQGHPEQHDQICEELILAKLKGEKDLYSCDFNNGYGRDGVLNVTVDGDNGPSISVSCGTKVPYHNAHWGDRATVAWARAKPKDSFYTLAMVDPDSPTPDTATGEVLHYLEGNIPGLKLQNPDWAKGGDILSTYKVPSPPQGSDRHRYVYLLYEQPSHLDYSSFSGNSSTFKSIGAFAEAYSLGDPVASNFFVSEWACAGPFDQCGGGPTTDSRAEGATCCHGAYKEDVKDSYECYEKDEFYYQCRPACPDDTPSWECQQQN